MLVYRIFRILPRLINTIINVYYLDKSTIGGIPIPAICLLALADRIMFLNGHSFGVYYMGVFFLLDRV